MLNTLSFLAGDWGNPCDLSDRVLAIDRTRSLSILWTRNITNKSTKCAAQRPVLAAWATETQEHKNIGKNLVEIVE